MRPKTFWLLPLLLASATALAEERTVTTSGAAAIDIAPDEATVALGVETFGETVSDAKRRNAEACSALLKAIRSHGIGELDIATAALEVKPEYKEQDHPAKGVEGYFVTRDYTVRLRQLRGLEALVDAAFSAGVNRLLSIEFGSSKQAQLREDARASAARAARVKAETLVSTLGGRLGSIRAIKEENPEWGRGLNFVSSRPDDDPGQSLMPAGMVRVQARVTVVFELLER